MIPLLWITINLCDGWLTSTALNQGAVELNPIIRAGCSTGVGVLAVKILAAVAVLVVIGRWSRMAPARNRRIMGIATYGIGLVCVWNIFAIGVNQV